MKIEIHYFAAFREATGIDSEPVDTQAETAAALFAECADRHPALRNYSASLVAVNDEMAEWGYALANGDKVLFFPPVAGG
jgi:molybdopterin converting factor small subunit